MSVFSPHRHIGHIVGHIVRLYVIPDSYRDYDFYVPMW
jgi:hypothetical protein